MVMFPVKMSDREKKLAAVAALAVIFYFFYQFLLTPRWQEILKLRQAARQARLEIIVARAKLRVLDALEGKDTFFVKGDGMSREEKALQVLRELSQATSKSGLNLISIRPTLNEGEGLKFTLACSGSYQNLYDFLRILDRADIAVRIDSLEMKGGGSEAPNLKIKMFLAAYY